MMQNSPSPSPSIASMILAAQGVQGVNLPSGVAFKDMSVGILWDGEQSVAPKKEYDVPAVRDGHVQPEAKDVRLAALAYELEGKNERENVLDQTGFTRAEKGGKCPIYDDLSEQDQLAIAHVAIDHISGKVDEFMMFLARVTDYDNVTVTINSDVPTYLTGCIFRDNCIDIGIGDLVFPNIDLRVSFSHLADSLKTKATKRAFASLLASEMERAYRERGFFVQKLDEFASNDVNSEMEREGHDDENVDGTDDEMNIRRFRISWFKPGFKQARKSVDNIGQLQAYAKNVPLADIFLC